MTSEPWSIVPLGPRHDHAPFDSGAADLDAFLKKFARQNDERGISRTYVAVLGDDPRIRGYYTIRMGAVESRDFPAAEVRRLPRYPVPVMHLARLAVDRSCRGRGLGSILLASVLKKSRLAAEIAGLYAVEVIAKSDEARGFYRKFGFTAFPDDPLHLYLPIATVKGL